MLFYIACPSSIIIISDKILNYNNNVPPSIVEKLDFVIHLTDRLTGLCKTKKEKKQRQTKRIWNEIEGARIAIHTNNINLPSLAILIFNIICLNAYRFECTFVTSLFWKLTFILIPVSAHIAIAYKTIHDPWRILPNHCLYTT